MCLIAELLGVNLRFASSVAGSMVLRFAVCGRRCVFQYSYKSKLVFTTWIKTRYRGMEVSQWGLLLMVVDGDLVMGWGRGVVLEWRELVFELSNEMNLWQIKRMVFVET